MFSYLSIVIYIDLKNNNSRKSAICVWIGNRKKTHPSSTVSMELRNNVNWSHNTLDQYIKYDINHICNNKIIPIYKSCISLCNRYFYP